MQQAGSGSTWATSLHAELALNQPGSSLLILTASLQLLYTGAAGRLRQYLDHCRARRAGSPHAHCVRLCAACGAGCFITLGGRANGVGAAAAQSGAAAGAVWGAGAGRAVQAGVCVCVCVDVGVGAVGCQASHPSC